MTISAKYENGVFRPLQNVSIEEGTVVEVASSIDEVRNLLEAGLSVADVVLPRTRPAGLGQLDLFE